MFVVRSSRVFVRVSRIRPPRLLVFPPKPVNTAASAQRDGESDNACGNELPTLSSALTSVFISVRVVVCLPLICGESWSAVAPWQRARRIFRVRLHPGEHFIHYCRRRFAAWMLTSLKKWRRPSRFCSSLRLILHSLFSPPFTGFYSFFCAPSEKSERDLLYGNSNVSDNRVTSFYRHCRGGVSMI